MPAFVPAFLCKASIFVLQTNWMTKMRRKHSWQVVVVVKRINKSRAKSKLNLSELYRKKCLQHLAVNSCRCSRKVEIQTTTSEVEASHGNKKHAELRRSLCCRHFSRPAIFISQKKTALLLLRNKNLLRWRVPWGIVGSIARTGSTIGGMQLQWLC